METMYQPGSVVFEDWVIQRKIGSGGYGIVYELKRDYYGEYHAALKVIAISRSDSEVENL